MGADNIRGGMARVGKDAESLRAQQSRWGCGGRLAVIDRVDVIVASRARVVAASGDVVAIFSQRVRRGIRSIPMVGRRCEITLVGAIGELLVGARAVIDRVNEIGGLPRILGRRLWLIVVRGNRVVVVIVADSIVVCHAPTLRPPGARQQGLIQQFAVFIDIFGTIDRAIYVVEKGPTVGISRV